MRLDEIGTKHSAYGLFDLFSRPNMFCVIKIQQFTITEIQVTLLLYISKKLKFP